MSTTKTKRALIAEIQKWLLDMCDDKTTCGHDMIRGTKDGLGVCEECGDRGVFNLSAKEIAEFILKRRWGIEGGEKG